MLTGKLTGKTILITGASSGIGKAVALRAARDKCNIILASRNIQKLNEVKAEVERLGSTAEVMQCDVTKVDEIRNLFLKAAKQRIDVVFNNAGLGFVKPLYELTVDEIQEMINVNITGMILTTKFASEVMTRQKSGHIIMTSSLAGLITLPQWSVYCSSKWAITGFADSIRPELKKYNIKVTTLHPGIVKTEFFKTGGISESSVYNSGAITTDDVAEEVYRSIFTNKHKIIVPAIGEVVSFIYKLSPGLFRTLISKMLNVKYSDSKDEDEPEFDNIKIP
jgi:short-subunit dehydrogenase